MEVTAGGLAAAYRSEVMCSVLHSYILDGKSAGIRPQLENILPRKK
jgi:hypothetical protein